RGIVRRVENGQRSVGSPQEAVECEIAILENSDHGPPCIDAGRNQKLAGTPRGIEGRERAVTRAQVAMSPAGIVECPGDCARIVDAKGTSGGTSRRVKRR